MIKVLQIGLSDTKGGIESFLLNCYHHINRELVQFDFITYSENPVCVQEIERLGGRIKTVTPRKKSPRTHRRELQQIITEGGYRAVHLHLCTASNITPLVIAKECAVPIRIAHSHNSADDETIAAVVLHRYNKAKLKSCATHYFACSDTAAIWMFGSTEQVEFISNGIDTAKFAYSSRMRLSMRKKMGFGEKLVVGHVGRFVMQKNHSFLLEIFAELTKRIEAVLVLVGEGEFLQQTIKQAEKLAITDRVKFLGQVEEIPKLLQSFDIFLMPSLYEGLPVSVLEAQTTGLPCYLSDTISPQCAVVGCHFISLEKTPSEWAEYILSTYPKIKRVSGVRKMKRAGFDVTCFQRLQDLYLGRTDS